LRAILTVAIEAPESKKEHLNDAPEDFYAGGFIPIQQQQDTGQDNKGKQRYAKPEITIFRKC
jgi:hypothetical protein